MKESMIQTHQCIDRELCGTPLELAHGRALVELVLTDRMRADATGLVHGGFLFGLADYAAMLAVNMPTVVLAGAQVSFKKPALSGDRIMAEARVTAEQGKKRTVEVSLSCGDTIIFEGTFSCFVPETHVLEGGR
jgi:uncharacterized protein (TIGR00369 family)